MRVKKNCPAYAHSPLNVNLSPALPDAGQWNESSSVVTSSYLVARCHWSSDIPTSRAAGTVPCNCYPALFRTYFRLPIGRPASCAKKYEKVLNSNCWGLYQAVGNQRRHANDTRIDRVHAILLKDFASHTQSRNSHIVRHNIYSSIQECNTIQCIDKDTAHIR